MAGVLGGGETLRKLGCHGKVFVVTNNRHVVQIEDLEHPQMKWGLRCPMALPTLVWNLPGIMVLNDFGTSGWPFVASSCHMTWP